MADFKMDSRRPFNVYPCYHLKVKVVVAIVLATIGITAINKPLCIYSMTGVIVIYTAARNITVQVLPMCI